MSFTSEEIEEFKAEAIELLDLSEKSLLGLDIGESIKESFDCVFRGFHNLKGAAGMMEMPHLQAHMHELENILMNYKESSSIPKPYIDLFLRGIDAARALLDGAPVQFSFDVQGPPDIDLAAEVDKMTEVLNTALNEESKKNDDSLGSALVMSDQVLAEFFSECEEIIERVSDRLRLLESGKFTKADLDSLYRDVHSLKGSAYLFSYEKLGDIAHIIENSLEPVRDGTHGLSNFLVDGVFKCLRVIEKEIQCLKNQIEDSEVAMVMPELKKLLENTVAALPLQGEVLGGSGRALSVGLSNPITSETLTPIVAMQIDQVNLNESESTSELKSQKVVDEMEDQNDKYSVEILGSIEENESHVMTPSTVGATTATAVTQRGGRGSAATASQSSGGGDNRDGGGKDGELNSSVRVPVALLDNLMTLMGEMVLVRNQVLQYSNTSDDMEFQNLSKHLNVVTSEIQAEMMKTRMQPIGNILNKFNRVVRDLSHDLKKSINLNLSGAETELDKSLLESIKDPLTHIVRNSCDHGIETPDLRRQAGKPEAGTINIKSYHEGGQVVIEIHDDGKGLHKDALIKKGIEKGLLTEIQAKQMSDKEVFNLIFAPGFSTAAKVTNVSGRGVGMDVVKTNIEKIGGTVDLISTAGRGTTICIKIPLTLAIVPALIVRSGEGIFAIPQVKLVELVRVDQTSNEHKIEFLQGTPVYRLRGNILPLLDLSKVLAVPSKKDQDNIVNIAVLNAEHCLFGVIVDEIHDTADIVVKPLNRLLKSLQVYSGATILGDGSVALILDVLGLTKVNQIGTDTASRKDTDLMESNSKRLNGDLQDYLLVRVNSPTKHAIVLNYVQRLEEFKISQIEKSGNKRVIRYRNTILPLISVDEELGYSEAPLSANPDDVIPVVVIQKAGRYYGLLVNGILDTLSTKEDVDMNLVVHKGIFGNLNTADELIVVMDPFEIIGQAYPVDLNVASHSSGGLQKGKPAPTIAEVLETTPITTNCESLRILLVEDTKFFRNAITNVLIKGGHLVECANDGQEGLEILQREVGRFDLVISDIEMPRMNGFELAQAIRKDATLAHLPLLAISSKADASYSKKGLESGFNVYLEKLKAEILLKAVKELTETKEKVA